MQPSTYQTITGQEFQILACPTQEAPLTSNTAAAKVTMWIQQYASQVYQCCEMVNAEEILKQQLLQSLDEKHFKGQRKAYINYANCTCVGLIHNLCDDHGTISPMDIEEREQKMNLEWYLIIPMVYLFDKIEEVVELAEAANKPIPRGKVVNIYYLLIFITGGM